MTETPRPSERHVLSHVEEYERNLRHLAEAEGDPKDARIAQLEAELQQVAGEPMTETPRPPGREWVVIISKGIWSRCYGRFTSYEACVEWTKANQWHPSDVDIRPIVDPEEPIR